MSKSVPIPSARVEPLFDKKEVFEVGNSLAFPYATFTIYEFKSNAYYATCWAVSNSKCSLIRNGDTVRRKRKYRYAKNIQ